MCHLLWLDWTGCEDSPCYDDTFKNRIWIVTPLVLYFKCNAIAYTFHLRGVVLRSISIGVGVHIVLCVSPLSPKSCVIYMCPMGYVIEISCIITSSFRTRSFLVWPHVHLNMRTASCWTCHLLVGQHSTPYNIAG